MLACTAILIAGKKGRQLLALLSCPRKATDLWNTLDLTDTHSSRFEAEEKTNSIESNDYLLSPTSTCEACEITSYNLLNGIKAGLAN